MAGTLRRERIQKKCEKCDGTGAPLWSPGDPTSGHDLSETCSACGGSGRITTIITVSSFATQDR